jgi:hypothetical protein
MKTPVYFRPLVTGNASRMYFTLQNLIQVSFKHTVISLTGHVNTLNSMRTLHNTKYLGQRLSYI